jgi:hypothetical protein
MNLQQYFETLVGFADGLFTPSDVKIQSSVIHNQLCISFSSTKEEQKKLAEAHFIFYDFSIGQKMAVTVSYFFVMEIATALSEFSCSEFENKITLHRAISSLVETARLLEKQIKI